MRSLPSPLLTVAAVAVTLASCATGSGDGSPRRSANRITAEELAEVAQLDCPQAIRRFRPDRLRTRISAFPAIFVDGIQSLDPESLRVLPTTDADATAQGVAPPG